MDFRELEIKIILEIRVWQNLAMLSEGGPQNVRYGRLKRNIKSRLCNWGEWISTASIILEAEIY